MNRTGLVIALTIGVVVGVVFGVVPRLDLAVSTPFFDPKTHDFPLNGHVWSKYARDAAKALITLLVIVVTEGFAWRSSLLYAALGGVLALSLSYGLDFAGLSGDPENPLVREREVLAAAGIAGGFVYWLFAGRRAGSWK